MCFRMFQIFFEFLVISGLTFPHFQVSSKTHWTEAFQYDTGTDEEKFLKDVCVRDSLWHVLFSVWWVDLSGVKVCLSLSKINAR